jgi:hypothetical protein
MLKQWSLSPFPKFGESENEKNERAKAVIQPSLLGSMGVKPWLGDRLAFSPQTWGLKLLIRHILQTLRRKILSAHTSIAIQPRVCSDSSLSRSSGRTAEIRSWLSLAVVGREEPPRSGG